METSDLQDIVFQVLRDLNSRFGDGKNKSQLIQDLSVGTIADKVAWITYKAALWKPSELPRFDNEIYIGALFPKDDVSTVRSILWRLVNVGILTPRIISDDRNQFFEFTGYGRKVIKDTKESPYDPFGFIKRLTTDCPKLESDSIAYIQEAISCFLSRYLRAASVMIGLASENEILSLIDRYSLTLCSEDKIDFEKRINSSRSIKEKFEILYNKLRQNKSDLPMGVNELDTWLQGVFQIIRLYRNDAGHPVTITFNAEDVYANLVLFRTYARYLSQLKAHFATKIL